MSDIIRVKNVGYDRYEELLLRRDAVKKEAFQYEREYVREFGDLILEIFQLKIECIRRKKTIEYCQAAANHGQAIDQAKLQEYLQEELAALNKQLDGMIEDAEAAKQSGKVTEVELLQIKRIYHKLVKLLHPDINPMTEESEQLRELWQHVVLAYNCNDLKLMQETEVLAMKALEQLGNDTIDIEIPNLDEKIAELEAEIERIMQTDPYQYKFLLEDPKAIDEKKASLAEEKKSYEEYSKQLDEILGGLLKNGVSLIWRMN